MVPIQILMFKSSLIQLQIFFFSDDKDKLSKVRGNWKLKNKIGWPLQPRTGRSVTILSDYKPILKGLKMFGDHCSKASVYAKMRLSLLKHL